MAQHIDDFRGRLNGMIGAVQPVGSLLHGFNAGNNFFARTVGDIQQHLCGICDSLDGSHHLIDGRRRLRNAGGLHLGILHHVLHVDAHFVHGAGNFFNGRRSLHADFRGLVSGPRHLIRTGRNLSRGIAGGAHQILEAM